jgi:hypothetical protein
MLPNDGSRDGDGHHSRQAWGVGSLGGVLAGGHAGAAGGAATAVGTNWTWLTGGAATARVGVNAGVFFALFWTWRLLQCANVCIQWLFISMSVRPGKNVARAVHFGPIVCILSKSKRSSS